MSAAGRKTLIASAEPLAQHVIHVDAVGGTGYAQSDRVILDQGNVQTVSSVVLDVGPWRKSQRQRRQSFHIIGNSA